MKPTDFSRSISDFITKYLPNERGFSQNTIRSYRDTFILLIRFIRDLKHIKIEKLTINYITKELVLEFLNWLENERNCSTSTRNSRLAAIHSFCRYTQEENLDYLHECQRISSIRLKKTKKHSMNYLTIDGTRLLLQQPDTSSQKGRRDLALLSILYDTGSRVQEIIDLTPSEIRFDKPYIVRITGKGGKTRLIPMLDSQVIILKNYMKESNLDEAYANKYPLFSNSRKEKLTRQGINHILKKICKNGEKHKFS